MGQFFRALLGQQAGAAPSLPTDLSGLWVWHKRGDFYSDTGSTLQTTNGGTIRQWSDSSGNGHHLGQATSGQRPTLDTGTTHLSKNTALLTASNTTWWGWPFFSLPSSSAVEYFVVAKTVSDAPSNGKILLYAGSEGGGSGGCLYPDTDGHIKDGTATSTKTDLGAHTLHDDFHVYNLSIDTAAGLNAYLDGVSIHSDATSRGGSFNKIAAGLGANADSPSSTTAFDGWVFELVIYSRLLSGTERAAIYAYLTS